jgi:hypothetical protein
MGTRIQYDFEGAVDTTASAAAVGATGGAGTWYFRGGARVGSTCLSCEANTSSANRRFTLTAGLAQGQSIWVKLPAPTSGKSDRTILAFRASGTVVARLRYDYASASTAVLEFAQAGSPGTVTALGTVTADGSTWVGLTVLVTVATVSTGEYHIQLFDTTGAQIGSTVDVTNANLGTANLVELDLGTLGSFDEGPTVRYDSLTIEDAPAGFLPLAGLTDGTLTAAIMAGTAAAVAPVLTGGTSGQLTAAPMSASAAAVPPTLEGEVAVSGGGPMSGTAQALVAAIAGSRSGTLGAAPMTAASQALTGQMTGGTSASLTATPMPGAAAAPAGMLAGQQSRQVAAVVTSAAAMAIPAAISVASHSALQAPTMTAAAQTPTPDLAASRSSVLAPPAATCAAAVLAGITAGEQAVVLRAVAALAAATALAAALPATRSGQLSVQAMPATAVMLEPALSGGSVSYPTPARRRLRFGGPGARITFGRRRGR